MKRVLAAAASGLAVLALLAEDTGLLSNLKGLTHGGQNTEAYWGPGVKRIALPVDSEAGAATDLH
jgi:hypothetical protein